MPKMPPRNKTLTKKLKHLWEKGLSEAAQDPDKYQREKQTREDKTKPFHGFNSKTGEAQPAELPEIKPGTVIWAGRFRNRPAIITKVYKDEKGKLKYEMTPIPQGRKHVKVRNILPFAIMEPADAAKYRKQYDDEQREKRKKSARVVERYLAANELEAMEPSPRGRTVWASEDGMHRVSKNEGVFHSQFRIGRQWYTDDSFEDFKDALRAVRVATVGNHG